VCANPDAGEKSKIQEIKAGDVFGADHFFSFSVCTYSAVAIEACRLKILDKAYRFKWLAELPGLENKLQAYCGTLEKASDIIVRDNIERRAGASRSSSVRATLQTIDSDKLPEDWSRSARFSEVSPAGAGLELKLGKPEDAEALLGESLKISFTLQVAGAEKQAHVTARVVAIDFLPFGECAMHIQFIKALSEKVVALF
jgi:CRP-like cAMP-binding protein